MTINQDKVPINLDDALMILKDGLTAGDIAEFKKPNFDSSQLHHSLGTLLRNDWSLWQKDTIFVTWFKDKYGIDNADSISSMILECLCRDINGLPRNEKEIAKKFVDYWKNQQ